MFIIFRSSVTPLMGLIYCIRRSHEIPCKSKNYGPVRGLFVLGLSTMRPISKQKQTKTNQSPSSKWHMKQKKAVKTHTSYNSNQTNLFFFTSRLLTGTTRTSNFSSKNPAFSTGARRLFSTWKGSPLHRT